jgi:outer membrane protein OmpA-like peptidoglycan-associated protein
MMKHRVIRVTWYERLKEWKIYLVVFVLFFVPRTTDYVWASFEDSPVGGRGVGVDGAMTATADDVYALYYNPAGTAFLTKSELGMQLGQLYGGLTDGSNLSQSYLGYVYPFRGEAIGFSYNALNLTDLYKEETFGLSYAWKIADNFSLGVTGKNYRKTVGSDFNTQNAELNGVTQIGVSDPVFLNGHVADAWGGDMSALYLLENGWKTGFMIRNVNEANMALGSGDNDPVPRSWNWGVARSWNNHTVMLDLSDERFTQMQTVVHAGVETWVMGGRFGLRAGGGYGEGDYEQITAGFSYRMSFLQFDYGFMIPFGTIDGTTGTQQLSLTFRFGLPPAKPLLQPVYEESRNMDLNDLLGDSVDFSTNSLRSGSRTVSGELTVTPAYVSLKTDDVQPFKAHFTGFPDDQLAWNLTPELGSISQNGRYQAPAKILFPQDVWVTAKSATHHLNYERAVVHLLPSTNGPVTFHLSMGWDTGESTIKLEYLPDIEKLAQVMRQYPQVNAVIKGYTDDEGSVQTNRRLSEKRAEAVRIALVRGFGIDPTRVIAQQFSATNEEVVDPTAENRRINRWVEAELTVPNVPLATVPDSDVNP